jgi:formate dehydrogenase subunit beta
MTINHLLRVRTGDALTALREFLAAWWVRNRLEALLAPVETAGCAGQVIQVIEEPAGLAAVNPFAPVMHNNVAAAVAQMAEDYAGARVAALLRPCELRALVELRKRRRTPGSGCLVLVGVDCLGTFPPQEYEQEARAHGASQLTREALAYAAEGGFTPQRLRPACQMCDWPAPCGADLTIGAIGVAPEQYLLVIARDAATDAGLHLGEVTDGLA